MGGKRRKKIDVGEIKNRRGERSYFTRFFAFFPIAEPGLPGYHHHHQHQHQANWINTCKHTTTTTTIIIIIIIFFLLLLFFGIIQSQAANCKLPKRSEIYNCRFKNTNIVSIFIIVVIIEFGSCCKFGFFFPSITSFYSPFNFYFRFIALGYLLVCSMCTCYMSNLISG